MKLPDVDKAEGVIKSKKLTGELRSEIIINNNIHFFIENRTKDQKKRRYKQGYFGIVKKGYLTSDDNRIIYSIKKPKNIEDAIGKLSPIQACQREAKYNHLQGRQAFCIFHKNWPRLVSNWQSGEEFFEVSKNDVLQQPLKSRLKWFISALADLTLLHENYRVHGDISLSNLVLDIKKESLKLIDFGRSSKPHVTSLEKSEVESEKDFCDEVDTMGWVMKQIFLEYINEWELNGSNFELDKNSDTLKHAFIMLYKVMRHKERDLRCRCIDALNYCCELLNNFENLNHKHLRQIANHTIYRSDITVADVLHTYLAPGQSNKV